MHSRLLPLVSRGVLLALVAQALAIATVPAPAQASGLSVHGTPLQGAVLPDGSVVRLSAPKASSVSWVLDGVYLGRDARAPFELTLATRPGAHKLKARSETRDGRETTYQVRFHTVVAAPVSATPPVVGATTPDVVAGAPEIPASVPEIPAAVSPAPAPPRPPVAPPPGGATPAPGAETTGPPAAAPAAPTPAAPRPGSSGPVLRVAGAAQLQAALAVATPGQVIELADGVYRGRFTLERAGTPAEPIVLRGGRGAVLDAGDVESGYALHLVGADHVRLEGFAVRGGQKGVVLDEADHVVLAGLDVGHTGMEAVHFRTSSSDNRLEGSSVHDTGLVEPGYGEGVYIGSATSHWDRYGDDGGPDRSDRNVVHGNHIYDVTAENVDVKEGTTGGVLSGNTFDGSGMTGDHYADSWIDLKGNAYLVTGNTGTHTLLDGFQTHVQLDGWGRDNVFRDNRLAVTANGVGINVHRADASSGNRIGCDNVATPSGTRLANLPCR